MMRLTLKEKRSVTGVVAAHYQKASKKEKRSMLDEFTQLTGYNRCYASHLLSSHGKQLSLKNARFVAKISKRTPHGRQKIYDHNEAVLGAQSRSQDSHVSFFLPNSHHKPSYHHNPFRYTPALAVGA
jgi:hypothetical protein